MDRLTAQQRHVNMAAIRSKDTKPEMIVRCGLWKRGFRYRLYHKRLPGYLDLVLRKYHTCIFCPRSKSGGINSDTNGSRRRNAVNMLEPITNR